MVYGQFPPINGLKVEFVPFEAKRDNDAGGISLEPLTSRDFLSFKKGQSLFLGHT